MLPTVAIVGTGNVAWHLSLAFHHAGIKVKSIANRDLHKSEKFISEQGIPAVPKNLNDLLEADIIFLCISDKALLKVIETLNISDQKLIVHTSGSHPLSVFKGRNYQEFGVFYPFQTFTKEKRINFREVPIFVEGSSEKTENRLTELAKVLSGKVHRMNSSSRMKLHIAGIFASNFTNLVLWESDKILASIGLERDIIQPLVDETVSKAFSIGPADGQTGPAARGDLEIVEKHEAFLEGTPLAILYKKISDQIMENIKEK